MRPKHVASMGKIGRRSLRIPDMRSSGALQQSVLVPKTNKPKTNKPKTNKPKTNKPMPYDQIHLEHDREAGGMQAGHQLPQLPRRCQCVATRRQARLRRKEAQWRHAFWTQPCRGKTPDLGKG